MSDGKPNIIVSEVTEKHLMMRYPHLSKEDVKSLFVLGLPIETPMKVFGDNGYLLHTQKQLGLQVYWADFFNVDTIIDLFAGEDGIYFTIVEGKEMSVQDKSKEKVLNLFQEYDVEYIDYRVQDDEYSISLVKKGKQEEQEEKEEK
ncbi:hypothetical protein [Terribacillus sp. DMT04]|uniref:hypothetical protein n=1 Tax=Terribacillus sp. DMT04 TaxID=2850441 RepID=UPI001C2BD985|nr:hypothetical protein [Terribacillus sp. DMT04]QXE02761.1 hypothetical protein KS242_06160 [Terribacillus sp. DMT04]